jgi:hypothetical protein
MNSAEHILLIIEWLNREVPNRDVARVILWLCFRIPATHGFLAVKSLGNNKWGTLEEHHPYMFVIELNGNIWTQMNDSKKYCVCDGQFLQEFSKAYITTMAREGYDFSYQVKENDRATSVKIFHQKVQDANKTYRCKHCHTIIQERYARIAMGLVD